MLSWFLGKKKKIDEKSKEHVKHKKDIEDIKKEIHEKRMKVIQEADSNDLNEVIQFMIERVTK